MVREENGIPAGGVEVSHVFQVRLRVVAAPHVHRTVRNVLHGAAAGIGVVAGAVRPAEEQGGALAVGNHLAVHDGEVAGRLVLVRSRNVAAVVVEIEEGGRLVVGVSELVVEGRLGVGVDGGHLHAGGRVPVPEGHGESGVADEAAEGSLEEVQVESVEGEEEPGVVNLDVEIRKADLVVCAVAVSAVDVGLLLETARVGVGKSFHELEGSGELGYVLLVDRMSRWPHSELAAGWGRQLEIYDL